MQSKKTAILTFIMALALLTLVACSDSNKPNDSKASTPSSEEESFTAQSEVIPPEENDSVIAIKQSIINDSPAQDEPKLEYHGENVVEGVECYMYSEYILMEQDDGTQVNRAHRRVAEYAIAKSGERYWYSGDGTDWEECDISDPLADDEMSFLAKAYSLGYADKQLELLEVDGIPEDRILNMSDALSDGNSTPNGRYALGWYEVDFLRNCWFLFDTKTNRVVVLPDWENGDAHFEFLDDESFYARLNNAEYVGGVRFYNIENPSVPYASWNPADSGAANEKNQSLLYVYKMDSEKMILAFWCETPKEWEGRVEGETETYKITLFDYDGDIVKETDTGITLGQSKTGIAAPSFEKANAGRTPMPGVVYFDIGEISYEFNYQSGAVSKK